MTDLIPVPRQDAEALLLWTQSALTSAECDSYEAAAATVRAALADPPVGYWLSGVEVETLRTWRSAGGSVGVQWDPPASRDEAGNAAAVIDAILAACPEPEQFSDDAVNALNSAIGVKGDWYDTRDRILPALKAAGYIVTDAPR